MSSFNWKVIEEKPSNYSDVRVLIEDALVDNDRNRNDEKLRQPESALILFVKRFQLEKFYPNLPLSVDESKLSKKEKIIYNNDKDVILGDFDQFRLNNDLSLMSVNCKLEINSFLYFFWWVVSILRKMKEKKKVSSIVILDAALSIDRIVKKKMLNDTYMGGFEKLQMMLSKIIMNEKFYEILFENPKFLYHCSFQHFKKTLKLYPEQREILTKIHNAIMDDRPLLLGNQMPTGQGKTFLSIPLAKMLSKERDVSKKKCVLFACSNSLVNIDVAQNCLVGTEIHLWMAQLIKVDESSMEKTTCFSEDETKILLKIYNNPVNQKLHYKEFWMIVKRELPGISSDSVRQWLQEKDQEDNASNKRVLLRPYKRCFPSIWKQVYKSTDKAKNGSILDQWNYYIKQTKKIPDIIIADLDACLLMLKHQDKIGNPFIPYIDEFISDPKSNVKMAEICHYLPRQSVILSSVLPKFENIGGIVDSFCQRHDTTKDLACYRVSTADINIPCCIVDNNGYVRFPHQQIQTVEELSNLLVQIEKNPRIRRTYSPKFVYFWSKTISDVLPDDYKFCNVFRSIGDITPKLIVEYVMLLLGFLKDNFHHLELFQSYRPRIMNEIKKEKMFTEQCWEYDPKTLVGLQSPFSETVDLCSTLFENRQKLSSLLNAFRKEKDTIEKKINSLKKIKLTSKDKQNNTDFQSRQYDMEMMEEDSQQIQIEIDKNMVLNHTKHFQRFHQKESIPSNITSLCPMSIPDYYFESLSEDEIYQIFAGIGTYDIEKQTEYQRGLIMKMYHNFSFFMAGKDIIYGTNLEGLTNIFMDKKFIDEFNTSELFQYMGRVGRMGRSYNANIIASDESVVARCLSFDDSYEKENEVELLFNESLKTV